MTMKIYCDEYNIEANLTIGEKGVSTQHIEFIYQGVPVHLQFDAHITPKSIHHIPSFAKMAIMNYIEEQENQQNMYEIFQAKKEKKW